MIFSINKTKLLDINSISCIHCRYSCFRYVSVTTVSVMEGVELQN